MPSTSRRKSPSIARVRSAARARDREPVRVEEVLDLEEPIDVAPRVDALALARLLRTDRSKLGLPVTQHVRLDADQLRNLSDSIVELDGEVSFAVHVA